jgi:methionyl-tRNA synthetase
MPKFYITTTLPYVNATPHIGTALEFVLADIIARYQQDTLKNEVFFNTGTDEHGLKIHRKAEEEGIDTQAFVDKSADIFKEAMKAGTGLNIRYTNFIRTTDPAHKAAAQEFWKRCNQNGDIYKKTYQTKYCVGCELEKTDSELENGKCPLHPNLTVELIDEENYFFRWSKYQQPLLDFYKQNPDFVVPSSRFHEITKFVEAGLEDFSISRLKEKMPWGVPVPGDEAHVMYVWFDALVNYVSTLGWPQDEQKFTDYWGTKDNRVAVQICGKDNLRQQSAMWQGMLMSAGLPCSKQIIIHGFITSGGMKMSKSTGNVIDPFDVIKQYGTDALRYFLAREITTFEDSDFTWDRFKASYQSGLANGIGNLVSRTLKMASTNGITAVPQDGPFAFDGKALKQKFHDAMDGYNVKAAADIVWEAIAATNKFIEETEPFKKVKVDPEAAKKDIGTLLRSIWLINIPLKVLMPETSEKIEAALANISADTIPRLFPRIEVVNEQ